MKRLFDVLKAVWARMSRNGWASLLVGLGGPFVLVYGTERTAHPTLALITAALWAFIYWSYMDSAFTRGEDAMIDKIRDAIAREESSGNSRQDAQ